MSTRPPHLGLEQKMLRHANACDETSTTQCLWGLLLPYSVRSSTGRDSDESDLVEHTSPQLFELVVLDGEYSNIFGGGAKLFSCLFCGIPIIQSDALIPSEIVDIAQPVDQA